MVFSSVPGYLDPPNWQQQPNHLQQQGGGGLENSQLPLPTPPLPIGGGRGGMNVGTGTIRPNSMSERARKANLPQPEAALKCPRCDSTNTKFCYFNNYNLSQPRHFCKTCRRYWTRGGTLRNVPVGGGCRRNKKRSKGSSRSKSSAVRITAEGHQHTTDHIIGQIPNTQQQLPLLPNLNHLNDYNFEAIQAQVGGYGSNVESILASELVLDQWRLPQVQPFPFLSTGLDQAIGLSLFDQSESFDPQSLDARANQLANVKMDENHHQKLNLSRFFLGINSGNDQYLGSNNNAWTDLSGFTSSSTTHLL